MKNFYLSNTATLAIALALAAAPVLYALATYAATLVQAGLANSATIRVAQASSACPVDTNDTHFVGCSSVL